MDHIRFFFITNSPETARFAVDRGVDRLFVDLEFNGKIERQGHLNTVISRHGFDDLGRVRDAVPDAEVMVRLNPLFDGSAEEIEQSVGLGADLIMLPMFHTAEAVSRFASLVAGRARLCLLVETVGAMQSLTEIVTVPGVDEIHIGLNDLHLELGSRFMFEPMADGLVDAMAATIRSAGLPFGIGGVARSGEGLLPAEIILAEHVRLGSTAAILSRTFHRNLPTPAAIEADMDFAGEVAKLRRHYADYQQMEPNALLDYHRQLREKVAAIVAASRPRS